MNSVQLIGRITKDLELTKTTTGKSMLRFTLAVNDMNKAQFISCVAWEKQAETMAKYLKKGSQIGIQGRLDVSQYKKNNETKTMTTVQVNVCDFLSKYPTENKQEEIVDFFD